MRGKQPAAKTARSPTHQTSAMEPDVLACCYSVWLSWNETADIISKPSQNQYVSYRTDAAAAAIGLQLHVPQRNKNT